MSGLSQESLRKQITMTLDPAKSFATITRSASTSTPPLYRPTSPPPLIKLYETATLVETALVAYELYSSIITKMPSKSMVGRGRTTAEPNFASSALQAFTSKDNRTIVTAVGLFAVSRPSSVPREEG